MNKDGFNRLFWAFLFVMFDIRVGGFDILPDIVGYILFAMGFGILVENSFHFSKAKGYSFPLILLSLLQIYEPSIEYQGGINIGFFGFFGVIVGLVSIVLGLLMIYHLFMGIKDMAEVFGDECIYDEIYYEAENRWKQYLTLNIATLLGFVVMFIPIINILFIVGVAIASIVLMVKFMKFMKKCKYNF